MNIQVSGTIRVAETGLPIAGVVVEVFDADLLSDDFLGHTSTDTEGHYAIAVKGGSGFLSDRPDLYLQIKGPDGRLLLSTRTTHLKNIEKDTTLDASISALKLLEVGLIRADQLPKGQSAPVVDPALKRWTLQTATPPPPFAPIAADLQDKASLLELFATYMRALRKSADNHAPVFGKLATLFSLGQTLNRLEGHHYGVALGLRTNADPHPLSRFDNIIGVLWGATLEEESPWVGKSVTPLSDAQLQDLTGEVNLPGRPAFLGINHFNRLDGRAANQITFHALSYWLNLEDAPKEAKATWAMDRNGGNFISRQEPSVWPESPREVFSLNYRWSTMQNRPPLSWLVDELVVVGEGLFLGQLLFASRGLFSDFDPKRPAKDYAYRHMGYFLLWDDRWNAEARRLFPFLEIPVTAPGVRPRTQVVIEPGSRFTRIKLDDHPPANCNDAVFADLRRDLASRESLLHLLKGYSDELQDRRDNDSPLFARLQELFNRGAPVATMNGYYRGALISWHGSGIFDLFKKNLLNQVWGFMARYSPWTGKRFDPVSRERLMELTDGFETGEVPTTFGANTQSLRTIQEKELGRLIDLAQIWGEKATKEESVAYGYDLKNFFFIGRADRSLNPANGDKRIYQFNYRWPKLRTIVPDRYCIDEVVEIADGLFLGQLMYATNWSIPYDAKRPVADYKYGQFGYFLLLDEAWQQIRLRIGFDLQNSS